jgi:hypothetical protein
MKFPVGLVVFMLVQLCSFEADAKLLFGTDERITKLEDIKTPGPNGEKLFLGHKLSFHAFIAPYYVSDDGYVLGVVDEKQYFPLDAAKIIVMQANGQLPNPLPKYALDWPDYVWGYFLWLLLPVIGAWTWFESWREKRKTAAAVVANGPDARIEPRP